MIGRAGIHLRTDPSACGTPVVCSNASSLPEVAGDAALLVDPHDVDAIARLEKLEEAVKGLHRDRAVAIAAGDQHSFVLVTDKLRSYSAAKAEIGLSAHHEQGLRKNMATGAASLSKSLSAQTWRAPGY